MRVVVQRVLSASVRVGNEEVGSIEAGLLAYVGVERDDASSDAQYVAKKLAGLRVFADEDGRLACSVEQARGAVLVVSQFTLFGDVRRGRRPSFDQAATPEVASKLCAEVVDALRGMGLEVATGRFRATMKVTSVGHGPVTILIDSRKVF